MRRCSCAKRQFGKTSSKVTCGFFLIFNGIQNHHHFIYALYSVVKYCTIYMFEEGVQQFMVAFCSKSRPNLLLVLSLQLSNLPDQEHVFISSLFHTLQKENNPRLPFFFIIGGLKKIIFWLYFSTYKSIPFYRMLILKKN